MLTAFNSDVDKLYVENGINGKLANYFVFGDHSKYDSSKQSITTDIRWNAFPLLPQECKFNDEQHISFLHHWEKVTAIGGEDESSKFSDYQYPVSVKGKSISVKFMPALTKGVTLWVVDANEKHIKSVELTDDPDPKLIKLKAICKCFTYNLRTHEILKALFSQQWEWKSYTYSPCISTE